MQKSDDKKTREILAESQKVTRTPDQPKAYDEVNVEAHKTIHTQPKMARTVNKVHDKEADQERRETPPAPPAHEE